MNNYNFKGKNYDLTKQCLSLFKIPNAGKTGSGSFTKKKIYKSSKKNNNTVNKILKEFKGEIVNPGLKQYFASKIDYNI